jgi:carbon starvation protein CstA
MISFPLVLICLVIACAGVSITYALISPGETPRIVREAVSSFGLMFGGIIGLAFAILIIPWILGR